MSIEKKVGPRAKRIMFLNEKISNLFLVIENSNLSQTSDSVSVNYLQARGYVSYWGSLKLIKIVKRNRQYHITYTAKGRKIADVLIAAKTILQNTGTQFSGGKIV